MAGCRGGNTTKGADSAAALRPRPPGPVSERTIPVLCYHAMSPGAKAFYELPTEGFEKQLQALHEAGFQGVTASQLADYYEGKADLPAKSVCLTFDDEPKSIITRSKPLMDKYGFVGTAFLITDSVGGDGNLTWDDVQALRDAGWDIGSHTASHAKPTKIDAARRAAEFAQSKAAIEQHGGKPCAALAYPNGLYDAAVMKDARAAGYRVAFTIDRGPADQTDDPLRLPRQMVVNGNSMRTFQSWITEEKLHLAEHLPGGWGAGHGEEPDLHGTPRRRRAAAGQPGAVRRWRVGQVSG